MRPQPVSIIIPVHNKWQLTAACLHSLAANPPETDFEVLVVDNASTDETRTNLLPLGASLFGTAFNCLVNEENINFAGACNRGAREAAHDLLFFLNNDTLLTPNWHPPLSDALANDAALGAVGPLLQYEDGTVQHLGAAVFPDRSIHHFYAGIPARHPLARKQRSLSFITAAALLIRKTDFFTAGAFHEGYVNGLEDVELCYRLRRMGRTLTVIPEAAIYHLEGGTRNEVAEAPRNAPLLRERCPDLRRPEFHHIALADGYAPYLGLFFETFLAPAPDRLSAYAPMLLSPDAQAVEAVLEQEQFWLDGYQALAGLYEQTGRPDLALTALVRCSCCYPTIEVLRDVVRLAQKTNDEATASGYGALLRIARNTLRDKDFFKTRFEMILATAEDLQDMELARLIKIWRKRHGKEFLAS